MEKERKKANGKVITQIKSNIYACMQINLYACKHQESVHKLPIVIFLL